MDHNVLINFFSHFCDKITLFILIILVVSIRGQIALDFFRSTTYLLNFLINKSDLKVHRCLCCSVTFNFQ